MLFPACMGIELTSGFDSQMINALQVVPSWGICEHNTSPHFSPSKQLFGTDEWASG